MLRPVTPEELERWQSEPDDLTERFTKDLETAVALAKEITGHDEFSILEPLHTYRALAKKLLFIEGIFLPDIPRDGFWTHNYWNPGETLFDLIHTLLPILDDIRGKVNDVCLFVDKEAGDVLTERIKKVRTRFSKKTVHGSIPYHYEMEIRDLTVDSILGRNFKDPSAQ